LIVFWNIPNTASRFNLNLEIVSYFASKSK